MKVQEEMGTLCPTARANQSDDDDSDWRRYGENESEYADRAIKGQGQIPI